MFSSPRRAPRRKSPTPKRQIWSLIASVVLVLAALQLVWHARGRQRRPIPPDETAIVNGSPLAARAPVVSGTIVISQIYGGGGNSGSTYRNDFIELFNLGSTSVSVTGWSVQYASSAGTTWQVTNLSGSIAPGQYYLVQEAQGFDGTTNLPIPERLAASA